MKRFATRSFQAGLDLGILALALPLALVIRFEGEPPETMWKRLLVQLPYVVAAQYAILVVAGIPRFSWRHISLRDVTRIFWSVVLGAMLLSVLRSVLGSHNTLGSLATLPWGVIAVNSFLTFLGIAGVRVVRRLLGERRDSAVVRRASNGVPRTRTLLIGAGQAGHLVAKEISSRPDLGIQPVGFVDDDPVKQGTLIHGLPVLGSIDELGRVAASLGAEQVLITIAAASGEAIRRIRSVAETHHLPTKIIPGVYQIVGGQVNVQRIRPVAIEDLLRREPVDLDLEAIAQVVQNQVVLITGAGGSIGSELCRQIAHLNPQKILLLERSENALFNIHRELYEEHSELSITPLLVDITDDVGIQRAFATHRPHVVFHAAAHKHVPMMEWNAAEAVRNNVFGTQTLARAADQFGVEAFVMISTDKAVNPTSVMGTTKRIAELFIQTLSQRSTTRFMTVRFGNVLGSAGSVVPIFQEQIAAGGPVRVTDPKMVRYFMTIPEACQLVLQAAAIGGSGEILVLDMGSPVKILDLATDLIRLSGFIPGRDIEIIFTGIRPGEKLFEEIAVHEEGVGATRHPKIFVGHAREYSWARLTSQLEALAEVLETSADVRPHLKAIVPEYVSNSPSGPLPSPQLSSENHPLSVAHSGNA